MIQQSMLEREIREQPAVLAGRREPAERAAREAGLLLTRPGVTHLVITARGSSDNAARYAQYLLGQHLGVAAYLAAPSLFTDGRAPRLDGAAVIGISQSGQSPDVVGVLLAARAQGRPTLAITNDEDSPLARAADVIVPLLAGAEMSVAATKTYTATLAAIVQIAAAAGAADLAEGLDRLPDLMAAVLESALGLNGPVIALPPATEQGQLFLTVVGRGTGFATAAETALKIREVAAIRSEAFAVPDLLHGPIAANTAGSALWVVASPQYPLRYWGELAARLAAEGVRVTAVVPGPAPGLTAELIHALPQRLPGWLFDLVAVGYGQAAALRLGEQSGADIDWPHGLSKVTRTR